MTINKKYKPFIIILAMLPIPGLFTACGGGKESASVPIVLDAPIAYVKRPVEFDDNGALVPSDITDPIEFREGGDLYVRDRAAAASEERNVTSRFTNGLGDVKDVEFSDDGSTVIFAMRAPDIENADPEDQPKWAIWEYEISSDTLRQVSPVDERLPGVDRYHYVSPAYLPTGEIIFTSTRQKNSQQILGNELKSGFPALTENRQQQALVLHRMNANGSLASIRQLSFNQSHDYDPIVLSSGRVLFSRWDNAGSRNAINLYSINPDGTDLQLVYGAHSHDTGPNNSIIQFFKSAELSNGQIVSLLAQFNAQTGGGMLNAIDIQNFIDNNTPTYVNTGLVGPAQSDIIDTTINTDNSPSPGGLYRSIFPLNDGTSRYLVSWSPCRLQDSTDPNFQNIDPDLPDAPILPCTDENLANVDMVVAPPLYGLYIYDAASETQVFVIRPVEGIMFTDVAAATPGIAKGYIPDKTVATGLDASLEGEEVGILNIRSVYDVDGVDTAAGGIELIANPSDPTSEFPNRPARFLRIIKATAIPDDEALNGDRNDSLNDDAYGISTVQGMREIIGYAPIEPDGSVKVKVPANVPLSISILDINGRRISERHQNWIQVRRGDTLNCIGCHDHASGSPHGRADAPPSIYDGGQTNGGYFPGTNTDPMTGIWHDFGETMAEARTRLDSTALDLSVDIKYTDVWSDPAGSPENPINYLYADLTTPSKPISYPECEAQWSTEFPIVCRTVINYESHIHPIWSTQRPAGVGGNECITCHDSAATLDLTDGLDPTTNRENAYEALLAGGTIFSSDGATASGTSLSMFDTGSGDADHEDLLTQAELKLIAEWLDIGAQYYNDPFDVDAARFIN